MKGYKAFNKDLTSKHNGFQFEVGKTYHHNGEVIPCQSGFHFSKELKNVYNYYAFDMNTPVYEIEASGKTVDHNEGEKTACETITIVREVSLEEKLIALNLFVSHNRGSSNRGSDNRGSDNRGSDNRGSHNSGSYNRGSDNRGSDNRGSDNRGSHNRGIYNFASHCVGVFNYNSFLGDSKDCYCFNESTGMSILAFAKKYLRILREIKKDDFSSVDKLPNYTAEKWELIEKHL